MTSAALPHMNRPATSLASRLGPRLPTRSDEEGRPQLENTTAYRTSYPTHDVSGAGLATEQARKTLLANLHAKSPRDRGMRHASRGHFVTTKEAFFGPPGQARERPSGSVPRNRGTAPQQVLDAIPREAEQEALLPPRARQNYRPVQTCVQTGKFRAQTASQAAYPAREVVHRPTRYGTSAAVRKHGSHDLLHDAGGSGSRDPGAEDESDQFAPQQRVRSPVGYGTMPPSPYAVVRPSSSAAPASPDPSSASPYMSTGQLLQQRVLTATAHAGGPRGLRPPPVPPRPELRDLEHHDAAATVAKRAGLLNGTTYGNVFAKPPPGSSPTRRTRRNGPTSPVGLSSDDRDFATTSSTLGTTAAGTMPPSRFGARQAARSAALGLLSSS